MSPGYDQGWQTLSSPFLDARIPANRSSHRMRINQYPRKYFLQRDSRIEDWKLRQFLLAWRATGKEGTMRTLVLYPQWNAMETVATSRREMIDRIQYSRNFHFTRINNFYEGERFIYGSKLQLIYYLKSYPWRSLWFFLILYSWANMRYIACIYVSPLFLVK